MDLHRRAGSGYKRGLPFTAEPGRITVPYKGINARAALSELEPGECYYCYNLLPSEQGMRTRLGQREWTNGVLDSVRTIIPFHGAAEDRTDDKLFATGSDGIYDCSTSGASAATKVLTFATTGASSGYGVFIHWTAPNGDQYIQYADSVNGLIEYNATANTWAVVTSITGITETEIRYVAIHKLRIWYLLEDDPNAYYLPIEAKTGAATQFLIGQQFEKGGDCAGIYNYTRDAGDGPDDFFIAVSRGGDVLVYQGTDPSSASTWGLVGKWSVGTLVAGRKFGIEYGGDVFLLSANGLNSVEQLFSGFEATDNVRGQIGKITSLLRDRMISELTTDGWELEFYPAEGYMVIQSPQRMSSIDEKLHYCLHATVKGWGFWRDVDSLSMGVWREKFYYGNADGEIWYFDGFRDNQTIADPDGREIDFSLLTSYTDLGYPGQQKQVSFIRPFFTGGQLSSYVSNALYDYNISEIAGTGEESISGGALWDTALWDAALWGGEIASNRSFGGNSGVGVAVAVAIRGSCQARVTLAEITLAWRTGGFL